MRFPRHHGIYRSDRLLKPLKTRGRVPPPVGRHSVPGIKNATEGARPCSSSAMSSGRLFLDRVARQQSPSPLHRHPQIKSVDISNGSNYHRTVTASFPSCLTRGVHPIIGVHRRSSAARAFAGKRGVNNAQIALAWLLAQPGVTAPIIGALELKLDESELKALAEPYQPHAVLGHS